MLFLVGASPSLKFPPRSFVLQIGVKGSVELVVDGELASLHAVPCSVGFGGGDDMVDPAEGDRVFLFEVEDALEGGEDLGGC